jgi:hypothetical protein
MPESSVSSIARAFAAARRFSAATLDRWLRLGDDDQAALLRLAERLRLGENHFRDFLDWSEEIAVRDRCAIASVWAREPVASTLARDLGRNEMIVAVKSALRQLRFPQLAAAEARLADLVRQLKLPRGVRVHPPEHLDSDEVRIELSGRSAHALREQAAAVLRALSAPELDEIFRTLEQAP